jgi:Protein of unknown function (DUF4236)
MALRFRRSVKLAPGLRLNFSGSGMSLSAGPRGAKVNFGSRGAFLSSGIPGTGLYSRARLSGALPRPNVDSTVVNIRATVHVSDDGTLSFFDANGQPLSDHLASLAKRQQGDAIRGALEETAQQINEEREALTKVHTYTPSPSETPRYRPHPYEASAPAAPREQKIGLFSKLVGQREKIEARNATTHEMYIHALEEWKAAKAAHNANEVQKGKEFALRLQTDPEFMQQLLEERLEEITWPRETLVSFEVNDRGRSVAIDVDLPEIEDLPRRVAKAPERGFKLSLKELKGKPLQELYARHVHSIGIRIIGEAFATLPTAFQVTLSAFTQRTNPETGHECGDYVYSVSVARSRRVGLNFENLDDVDVLAAFEQFELKRDMGKDFSLSPIEPF